MSIQLIRLARKAAAAIRNRVQAVGRTRNRRVMRTMLEFDERLLRDIGLTRADIVECLSSPDADPLGVLQTRRTSRRAVALHVADTASDRRLAA